MTTRKEPLYVALAGIMYALENCDKSGNSDWRAKHKDRALRLVKTHMPSGSGLDSGTKLDFDRSTLDKLVFTTAFHHMHETGFYDGWTEHDVIVKPCLFSGFVLRITGRNRNDIKDYMYDCFASALSAEVDPFEGEDS